MNQGSIRKLKSLAEELTEQGKVTLASNERSKDIEFKIKSAGVDVDQFKIAMYIAQLSDDDRATLDVYVEALTASKPLTLPGL